MIKPIGYLFTYLPIYRKTFFKTLIEFTNNKYCIGTVENKITKKISYFNIEIF